MRQLGHTARCSSTTRLPTASREPSTKSTRSTSKGWAVRGLDITESSRRTVLSHPGFAPHSREFKHGIRDRLPVFFVSQLVLQDRQGPPADKVGLRSTHAEYFTK